MSKAKGQKAVRALQIQHAGPQAFLRLNATGLATQDAQAAYPSPNVRQETAGWRNKLPRISAIGANCVRYTVRLAAPGARASVRYHRLSTENDALPTAHIRETYMDDEGNVRERYFWVQQQGVKWLLTATLFGERLLTLQFASRYAAMKHAEAHANQELAWAKAKGRGKRSRRKGTVTGVVDDSETNPVGR